MIEELTEFLQRHGMAEGEAESIDDAYENGLLGVASYLLEQDQDENFDEFMLMVVCWKLQVNEADFIGDCKLVAK